MALIDRIQKELNATVIIIEHRLEEVWSQPIDRIILINDGEIVADKKPNDLLHENCLEDVGVRSPLYLNALKKANVDLTRIPDLTSVAALPQDPEIAKQLQEWQNNITLSGEKEETHPLLELKGVGHRYSKLQIHPLHDVTATINQGDFVSIVGQNGAGKPPFVELFVALSTMRDLFYLMVITLSIFQSKSVPIRLVMSCKILTR